MNPRRKDHDFGKAVWSLIFSLLCIALASLPAKANDEANTIPNGTILPVRLNSTISSAKCKPSHRIAGKIMQDVPLPTGAKIRKGSEVVGHIVQVTPATGSHGASVSLQFDKLITANQAYPITTDLRAIASFMEVMAAQTPPIGPGEGDVYDWLTTVQVGGDVVYGVGGPVTRGENSDDVVGKAIRGGALSHVKTNADAKCRGAIDGDDRLQALWVFSSDACGTYGLAHIRIAHAGRTDPRGVIILATTAHHLKIAEGAGILLRVIVRGNSLGASR
jgi:hypothetical protein